MRHAGTQEIETPRLLLRRLMPSDAPMMYANWANDAEVTRWLRWTPHRGWGWMLCRSVWTMRWTHSVS